MNGEVTEWPKVRDWKSRVCQKCTVGSTPTLSAITPHSDTLWAVGPGPARQETVNPVRSGRKQR